MEKKIPFFKKVIISIKDFDKYNLLIGEKLKRSILYFFELLLIFSLVVTIAATYKTYSFINQAIQNINANIPSFTINSEGLTLDGEEKATAENKDLFPYKILLDDNTDEINDYKQDLQDFDGISLVALKSKFYIVYKTEEENAEENSTENENSNTAESDNGEQIWDDNNKIFTFSYEEIRNNLGIDEITKENMINLIEEHKATSLSAFFLIGFISVYLVYILSTLIDALALSILVVIISRMAKVTIKYSQCFTVAVSALTLPIILNSVYSYFNIINGFTIPQFQTMYTIISYIYIIAAILIMRSDFIKKKQLIKATIDIQKLEKEQENKENPDEKDESKDEKEKKKEKPLSDVKKRVKNKLKEDKDKPEPQANIEGGKR